MTHNRVGLCWQFRTGDGEELIIALEYARAKHGDNLTGKVLGRPPTIKGDGEELGTEGGFASLRPNPYRL